MDRGDGQSPLKIQVSPCRNAAGAAEKAGPGHELAGSTVWGIVNACTDYIDHGRSKDVDAAINSSWFGTGAKDRTRVFDKALTLL